MSTSLVFYKKNNSSPWYGKGRFLNSQSSLSKIAFLKRIKAVLDKKMKKPLLSLFS
jgi:hypothetical protein